MRYFAALILLLTSSAFAVSRDSFETADAFFNHLSNPELAQGYRNRLRLLEDLFGKREIREWRVRSSSDYIPGTRSISVPTSLRRLSFDEAIAIFTHEYAHVIAEDVMRTMVPASRKLAAQLDSEASELTFIEEALKDGRSADQTTYGLLRAKVGALSAQVIALRGYHEFIADVFAVVLSGDDTIMARAIAHQYQDIPMWTADHAERRSFALTMDSVAARDAAPLSDPYDKFMATRIWFGRQPYAAAFKRDRNFLLRVVEASMKAANRHLEQKMTVEQLNANLQRKLRTAFR